MHLQDKLKLQCTYSWGISLSCPQQLSAPQGILTLAALFFFPLDFHSFTYQSAQPLETKASTVWHREYFHDAKPPSTRLVAVNKQYPILLFLQQILLFNF